MEDRPLDYYIKNFFGQSAVYGIGDIGTKVLNLLLIPIHTTFISVTEYSMYSLFILFYSFGLTFYLFGINSGFLRYYLDNEYKKARIFNTAFLFLSLFTVLLSIFIVFFSTWFSEVLFDNVFYRDLFYYGGLILIFESLSTIVLLVYRAQNNPKGYVTALLVKMCVVLISNVIFLRKICLPGA